jgi:hypothetical protein
VSAFVAYTGLRGLARERLAPYGSVTYPLRNSRADAVSRRYVVSVALQAASPVTVSETCMFESSPQERFDDAEQGGGHDNHLYDEAT